MEHPFAELIGLTVAEVRPGFSRCSLPIDHRHLNPHRVVHGAVLYALADTGMGAALYPSLDEGALCATIQLTMSYFKPARAGTLVCTTELVSRGKTVAHLESKLFVAELLVAAASGNYAIFKPSASAG